LQRITRARIGLQLPEQARVQPRLFLVARHRRCVSGRFHCGVETVDAVAVGAAYSGFRMVRAQEVWVSSRMAAETRRINLLRRHLAELQNLGRISAGSDMCLPWSVAALTSDPLAAMHERQLRMRIRGELIRKICVA